MQNNDSKVKMQERRKRDAQKSSNSGDGGATRIPGWKPKSQSQNYHIIHRHELYGLRNILAIYSYSFQMFY